MRDRYVCISWTAAPLSDVQKVVLQKIAILFLQSDCKKSSIDFTHELIEGRLTLKSRGLFVTMAGTFFHADMGMVRGERWTADFLLPVGMEEIDVNGGYTVTRGNICSDGTIGKGDWSADLSSIKVGAMSLLG